MRSSKSVLLTVCCSCTSCCMPKVFLEAAIPTLEDATLGSAPGILAVTHDNRPAPEWWWSWDCCCCCSGCGCVNSRSVGNFFSVFSVFSVFFFFFGLGKKGSFENFSKSDVWGLNICTSNVIIQNLLI